MSFQSGADSASTCKTVCSEHQFLKQLIDTKYKPTASLEKILKREEAMRTAMMMANTIKTGVEVPMPQIGTVHHEWHALVDECSEAKEEYGIDDFQDNFIGVLVAKIDASYKVEACTNKQIDCKHKFVCIWPRSQMAMAILTVLG